MKYYSEKTRQFYDSAEDCKAAEEALIAKEKAETEKAEQLKAQRKERAAELEQALKDVGAAKKKYEELMNAFLKDYGAYHYTAHLPITDWFSLFW